MQDTPIQPDSRTTGAPTYPSPLLPLLGFAGAVQTLVGLRYLALLTGYDASARSAALGLVLGGVAVGAGIGVVRRTDRRGPLRLLVLVHGAAGVLAALFHEGCAGASSLIARESTRWLVAVGLALPPSVLFGISLSLTAAALGRGRDAARAARGIYGLAGAGAALGAAATAAWLPRYLGLPGAMALAAAIHLTIGSIVAWRSRREPRTGRPTDDPDERPGGVFASAFVAASGAGLGLGVWAVGWDRLLRATVGSAESSASMPVWVLAGIALGAWLARTPPGRGDVAANAARAAVAAAAVAALVAIPVHGTFVGAFERLAGRVAHDEAGFTFVRLSGLLAAALLIVPAASGIGVSLVAVVRAHRGGVDAGRSDGRSFALLAGSAVAGAFFAIHLGVPLGGAVGTIVLGSLWLAVPWLAGRFAPRRPAATWLVAIGIVSVGWLAAGLRPNPSRPVSSLVPRAAPAPPGSELLFERDGRSGSVRLVREPNGPVRLLAEGDAARRMNPAGDPASRDEIATAMLVAIPLALQPDTRVVVHTGRGAATTTRPILDYPRLERIDALEIEPARIEAARRLARAIGQPFDAPTRRFHAEDPLAFLRTGASEYDLILSEPSVVAGIDGTSGVSREFYAAASRRLHPGGLLAQRIDLDEIDPVYLASVFKALMKSFVDYAVYAADDRTIVIVAGESSIPDRLAPAPFDAPTLARLLERAEVRSSDDLAMHRLGSRAGLDPLFSVRSIPAHSEYFPALELRAERTRFLGWDARHVTELLRAPIPVLEMLDPSVEPVAGWPDPRSEFGRARAVRTARALIGRILRAKDGARRASRPTRVFAERFLDLHRNACAGDPEEDRGLVRAMLTLAATTNPHVRDPSIDRMWRSLDCAVFSPSVRRWHRLHAAIARRDARRMTVLSRALFDETPERLDLPEVDYLATAGLVGALATDDEQGAHDLLVRLRFHRPELDDLPVYLRLALYHVSVRQGRWHRVPGRRER